MGWAPSMLSVPPDEFWNSPTYRAGGLNVYRRHESECEGQFVSNTELNLIVDSSLATVRQRDLDRKPGVADNRAPHSRYTLSKTTSITTTQ